MEGTLKASRRIHPTVISKLSSACLWYFETQPIGRILNRLSKDVDSLDGSLINAIDSSFLGGGHLCASTLMILITAPWIVLAMLPLTYIAYMIQRLYRT